jgi:hypothetical protein
MSKVKLIVDHRNSLAYGEVLELAKDLRVPEDQRIIGIVRTDFDPEENGDVRTSDDLDPVINIDNINYLVGQVLTLVEGTIADPDQRKAAKDLHKQVIWNWYTGHMETLTRTWRFDKGYETDKPLTDK